MIGYLRILSYVGHAPGACHYMPKIRIDDDARTEFEAERTLTAAEAKALNRVEQRREGGGDFYRYKAGDDTNRFLDRESAAACAIDVAKRRGIEWLFLGDCGVLDPQELLYGGGDGVVDVVGPLNEIWKEFEAQDGWNGDEKIVQEICDRWESIWRPIKNEIKGKS